MAGVDTSIYQNLLRPPRSVADYDNEFATTQANALGLQLKQQELAQVKQLLPLAVSSAEQNRDRFSRRGGARLWRQP